jgi:hypothetical protein
MNDPRALTFYQILGGYRSRLRKGQPFTPDEAEELISLLDTLEDSMVTAQVAGPLA